MIKMRTATLLLISLLPLGITACSSDIDPNEINTVRFALRDENIQSWHETGDGLEVELSNNGQRKIHQLTRDNHDKDMEIYAGRILLSSSTIHQTLHGESVFVPVDDDVKDRVIAFLPPGKRDNE